jgi:hypothetical protein
MPSPIGARDEKERRERIKFDEMPSLTSARDERDERKDRV